MTARKTRSGWLVALGLIVLSMIPLAGGAVRLGQLLGGAEITPDNARFFDSPPPVILHIVGAFLYALVGALQFVTRLRRPVWHRVVGRFLVPFGLVVAFSGMWMTLFYALPAKDGRLLGVLRLVFGAAMAVSLVLGYIAIRRRDIARHRAWMTRAYAIGLGAGTQVLTLAVGEIIAGPPDVLFRALLMGAAWVINLAVAEWSIRRRGAAAAATAP